MASAAALVARLRAPGPCTADELERMVGALLTAGLSSAAERRAALNAGALPVLTAALRDHVSSQSLAVRAAAAVSQIVRESPKAIEGAECAALVAAVVPALRRYADDDTICGAVVFMQALGAALATEAPHAAECTQRAAQQLGFAELAASLLRDRPARSLIFKVAWADAVANFSRGDAMRRAALAAGCVPLAARALGEHPADALLFDGVLRLAYHVLIKIDKQLVYTRQGDEAVRSLFRPFIAACAKHERLKPTLQRRGFAVLGSLPPYTPALSEAAGAAGVPAAAVAALRAHVTKPGDEYLLQDACLLLDRVCSGNEANSRAAAAAGVFEALVPVMRHAVAAKDGDEADTAVCVVAAVCVPVAEADCIRTWIDVAGLWNAGVVHAMADVVKVALRRGKDAATPLDVLGAFCGPLLSFLLLGKLSVEDALSAGALQACCAGLAGVHPTTSDTRYLWGLHKAIRLLDVLTADEPARADAALAAGALESVELHAPSMDRFYAPELIGIQMLGVEALFCPRPPGSARAALERVLERLRAAAARHDVSPCAAPRCECCAAAKRTCALPSCGAADGPFKHCANCKRAAYCCREHQLADWSAHKADCKKWRIA